MTCYKCGTSERVMKGVYADFCESCWATIEVAQAEAMRETFLHMITEFVQQSHSPDHLHVGKECVTCRARLGDILRFVAFHKDTIFPIGTPQ